MHKHTCELQHSIGGPDDLSRPALRQPTPSTSHRVGTPSTPNCIKQRLPGRLHRQQLHRDRHRISSSSTICLHRHRDLHRIKLDVTDPKYINVKLYDYIKLRTNISIEFYIVNKNIAKVYINVIFDRRRRLRQDPPRP
jgi:hypothetical protein